MTRVLRVIARLNIGGPAIQALTLTRELENFGYETMLVRGTEGADEGSMDPLARRLGVTPVRLTHLRRDPVPLADLRTVAQLVGILRAFRPALVHTHAAKAGTLGRVAVRLAFPPGRRPRVVHTFHGHSLTGYFSPRTSATYLQIERVLARRTDRLVAVSTEVRDELVNLGVAPAAKFSVIELGLDLTRFAVDPAEREARRGAFRRSLALPEDAPVVTIVARLVPIKRVDRFLEAAAVVAETHPKTRFVIVGDGELGRPLRDHPATLALGDRVSWTGFRDDIPDICFASDLVVLTSDNEGTPVSLIEAQAAGVPVICTRVGGAATVIGDGMTGLIAERSSASVASAINRILADPERAAAMGAAGQSRAFSRFGLTRLTRDIAALYRALGA